MARTTHRAMNNADPAVGVHGQVAVPAGGRLKVPTLRGEPSPGPKGPVRCEPQRAEIVGGRGETEQQLPGAGRCHHGRVSPGVRAGGHVFSRNQWATVGAVAVLTVSAPAIGRAWNQRVMQAVSQVRPRIAPQRSASGTAGTAGGDAQEE